MNDEARGKSYEVGDRVRIDIPDETHPDFPHHGKNGEVISVITGHTGLAEGEPAVHRRFRVDLDVGGTVDVRSIDLRPPI